MIEKTLTELSISELEERIEDDDLDSDAWIELYQRAYATISISDQNEIDLVDDDGSYVNDLVEGCITFEEIKQKIQEFADDLKFIKENRENILYRAALILVQELEEGKVGQSGLEIWYNEEADDFDYDTPDVYVREDSIEVESFRRNDSPIENIESISDFVECFFLDENKRYIVEEEMIGQMRGQTEIEYQFTIEELRKDLRFKDVSIGDDIAPKLMEIKESILTNFLTAQKWPDVVEKAFNHWVANQWLEQAIVTSDFGK